MIVDISLQDDSWTAHTTTEALVRDAIAAAAAVLDRHADENTEVSVALTGDDQIARLNETYRGKAGSTNVLSFAACEGGMPDVHTEGQATFIGDIVLAYETIVREALEQGKTFENHLCHLVVHGFLHCLGYDHEDDAQAREMENLERAALERMAIPDPYE